MKRLIRGLFALLLVVCIGLTGCSSASGLSGNYEQDTLMLINGLRTALEAPANTQEQVEAEKTARQLMNDFAALYRRDTSVAKLRSYTTVRTALNSLAGHYSSYPNRPVPDKLKQRLNDEFRQAELALSRGY